MSWELNHDPNIETKEKVEVKKPSQFQVIMHNDDYTTMDFVVQVLVSVFKKSITDATNVMLDVHQKGAGVCGTYTKEIAETKVALVHSMAKNAGFPLRCSLQKV